MKGMLKGLLVVFLLAGFTSTASAFRCQVCGKDGYTHSGVFIFTDKITGEKEYVCTECMNLPRCYICGMPVKDGGTTLPDGRVLCERDAKTAVLDVNETRRIAVEVENELDRTYARFTEFPSNVEFSVIDQVDISSMGGGGGSFESLDLLGLYQAVPGDRAMIRLTTGQPSTRLRDVCAHELSHGWVHDNVPSERHNRLSRDAEEGFCEMIAYLLVEAENDELEKKRILENRYTRGQVKLFLDAERQYGMEAILDWMRYGEAAQLQEGHLEEIRYVKEPPANPITGHTVTIRFPAEQTAPAKAPPVRSFNNLTLQGIIAGAAPAAIINGRTFMVNDELKLKVAESNETIRCLAIGADTVRIREVATGQEKDLLLAHP